MDSDYRFLDSGYVKFHNDLWEEPDRLPPRSELHHHLTYYTRAGLEAKTGVRYPLDRIKKALALEGLLPARDCEIPLWYCRKYKLD